MNKDILNALVAATAGKDTIFITQSIKYAEHNLRETLELMRTGLELDISVLKVEFNKRLITFPGGARIRFVPAAFVEEKMRGVDAYVTFMDGAQIMVSEAAFWRSEEMNSRMRAK